MRIRFKALAVISLLTLLTSCASINSVQDRELQQWQAKNIAVEEKSPTTAAVLNILPGFGDFYNGNIGYGVVNLLTWPFSVLWAPVGGANGAKERNYFASKAYVEELETKKKKLKNDLETAYIGGQMNKQQFFLANKKIETMELSEFQKQISIDEFLPKDLEQIERVPSNAK